MRQLVIHFGMSKTGSSSIQSTLARTTRLDRFQYLHVQDANVGRDLITAFAEAPDRMRTNRKRGLDRETLMRRRRAVLDTFERQLAVDADLFVLSTEMISLLDAAALSALRDWFAARVDHISLAGYVRDPGSYIESMLQQSLKGGNDAFDIARRYPAYQARFAPLEDTFGRDALRYRLFAPERFVHGCVVRDFLDMLGRTLDEDQIVRVNDGLSAAAVSLLYIYRQHGPAMGTGKDALRSNRRLIQALRSLTGPRFRLASELLTPVLDAMRDDMAWMETRLGEPLPRRAPPPADQAVHGEDDLLRIRADMGAWLAEHTAWRAAPGWSPRPRTAGRDSPGDLAAVAEALVPLCQGADAPGVPTPPPAPARAPAPPAPSAPTRADARPAPIDPDWLAAIRRQPNGRALDDEALHDIGAALTAVIGQAVRQQDGRLTIAGLGRFVRRPGGADGDGRIVLKLEGAGDGDDDD